MRFCLLELKVFMDKYPYTIYQLRSLVDPLSTISVLLANILSLRRRYAIHYIDTKLDEF